ncbi:MAG: HAMP domain-containing sensor histidine kinase [Chitinophagaceae bacterium]
MKNYLQPIAKGFLFIRSLGVTPGMDEYEKRKLAVFNILNFFGALSGIIIPVAGLFNHDNLPALAWIVACSPAIISMLVLISNRMGRPERAKMIYFTFYPVITSLVYASGLDLGIELFFVFYGVLAVFLLKKIANVLLSLTLSMALYFSVYAVWHNFHFQLSLSNYSFFLFNHFLAAIFIFLSLYLFKKENHGYQSGLLNKNVELENKNREIEQQRLDILQKALQLEKQHTELQELDGLKNKLFSIISHDLRAPMYALRDLFRNIQKYDLPGDEIRLMIPDVVSDLNYTTGLMENLLQWAKSQMQANATKPQLIDINAMIKEVTQLLRLQAESKRVYLETKTDAPIYIYADRDMINLVLRNLLSNAIKFTPEEGKIYIGAQPSDEAHVKVFVQDTGTGMNAETLKKINECNYFTTKGTANESGTGIGLMLCKEFLAKNGGHMHVESERGKGSVFSFVLPGQE